jgi:hypothetical protein
MVLKWTKFAEQYKLRQLRNICERYIMLHFQECEDDALLKEVLCTTVENIPQSHSTCQGCA